MTAPKRLLDGDGTELERLLLASALSVRPRAISRWRAAVFLFFASWSTTSKAAAFARRVSQPRLRALRWTCVGVASSAVAWAGVRLAERAPPELGAVTATRAAPGQSATYRTSRTAEPPPAVSVPEPAARDGELTPHPPLGFGPAATPSATAQGSRGPRMPQSRTQTGPDSLVLETEMLDSARRALSSGRADRASAELDAYERRFPKGALAEEALRLRIEAARRAGDVATAKRLAQAFSRRYPKSAYAKRLETLLSSDRRAP